MLAYILKRMLLMMPTLLGVLTLTFVVIQFVPGGPVEQIVARGARAAASGDAGGYCGAQRDVDAQADRGAQEALRLRQAARTSATSQMLKQLRALRPRHELLPATRTSGR